MTANTSLERRVAEHYASEPPLRAPDRVLHAAIATIETTPQRRGIFAPWRFTYMSAYTRAAAAAVVAVVVVAIGLWRFGGIGTAGPSPTPIPTPTVAPSAAQAPPLTETFTSNMHGISLSFPTGWAVTQATTPWTGTALPRFQETSGDIVYDPILDDHLFLMIASQPLDGAPGPAWADTIVDDPCETSEPITVDGAEGRLIPCRPRAMFWGEDRGYVVLLHHSSDEPGLDEVSDAAWFQEVLASVQIRPSDAGTADTFIRPFDYVLPGAPVFDYGSREARFWEVRVPAYNDAGHAGGLIVQAIGGGRVDPCDPESAALPLDSGADSIIAYLETIPELLVTEGSETTVDGRPAKEAVVSAASSGPDCPELWVWAEAGEPMIQGLNVRLVVTEVDGEPIVVTVFGITDNPELPALADGIIGSFDFAATE